MMFINKMYNICCTIILPFYYKSIGVKIGRNLKVKHYCSIRKNKKAKIIIGSNVTLNSDNCNYHINMFGACKLLADRDNAIIKIGSNTRIHGACIHAYNQILIGENVLIAANTHVIDGNGHALSFPDVEKRIGTSDEGKQVIIEDNVWIGANCFILGGVVIGRGSVISANSVVKNDIPEMSIAAGNPAKVIKSY